MEEARPRPAFRLAAVLLLGLALRLVVANAGERPLVFDERDYSSLGGTLARSGAYTDGGRPTAYRAPGYPAFLAGVQLLTRRPDPAPARISQAILDVISAALLYLLAAPWGSTVALAAALIWSLYPPAIVYARLIYPETLFICMFLLWLLLATRLSWKNRWAVIGLGAGAGVLTLVKAEAALLMVTVPAAAFFRGVQARAVALFVVGAALALAPWIVRNTRVMGEPVLITSGGPVLLIGNHPRATGGYAPDVPDSMLPRNTEEVAAAHESNRSALRYISEHPIRFLALGVRKTALVFASETELAVTAFHDAPSDPSSRFRRKARELPPAIPIGMSLAYAAVLLAGCFGYLAAPDDRIGWIAAAFLAAWLAAHFVTFGGSRYHHVLMPLAALGAARVAAAPRRVLAGLSGARLAMFAGIAAMLVLTWALEVRALLRP